MLNLYLYLTRTTKRMAVFQGQGEHEAFVYIPKTVWVVMGRPRQMSVELTPEEEYHHEGHHQDP